MYKKVLFDNRIRPYPFKGMSQKQERTRLPKGESGSLVAQCACRAGRVNYFCPFILHPQVDKASLIPRGGFSVSEM